MAPTIDTLTWRLLTRRLRRMGFKRDGESNAGGVKVVGYHRREAVDSRGLYRELDVQLWGDGHHRITHMIYRDPDYRFGRSTTLPTGFVDLATMALAIDKEQHRMDNAMYVDPEKDGETKA